VRGVGVEKWLIIRQMSVEWVEHGLLLFKLEGIKFFTSNLRVRPVPLTVKVVPTISVEVSETRQLLI
jgi:hypothetical protein